MLITFSQAISLLRSGQVIAVPTETVYGLAACLDQPQAIEHIFTLKGRPKKNPLIIHLADWKDLSQFVTQYPPNFQALAQTFWPGAFTCILPVNSNVPSIARAALPTAGFRVPDLPLTRHLIKETGPLVMPSANLSGRPSATFPKHVEEDFGLEFPVLEGGTCSKGVESTILFYQEPEWVILRLGAVPPEAFKPILGYEPRVIQKSQENQENQPLCPGQLFRHYAPRARLILGDHPLLADATFVLGFKERPYPRGKRIILLGSLLEPEEVAKNLYQALRQLDQEGANQAWVDMDFPRHGLWQTIAERLIRAGETN